MMLDAALQVSAAQALTGTALSDRSIDLGPAVTSSQPGGSQEPLCFVVQVNVAADHTTGNETYQFDVVQSDNPDLSSADVIASRIIPYSDLDAGSVQYVDLPAKTPTKRYLGMQYTLGGTSPTITVTSFLQPKSGIEAKAMYAAGSRIA